MKKLFITQHSFVFLLIWLLGISHGWAQCPGAITDANLAEALRTLYPEVINADNTLTPAAASVTKLDLSGWGNAKYANGTDSPEAIKTKPKLTTLQGIECFTSLLTLEASAQRIATLPAALPTSLEFLSLQSNSLTTLPVLPSSLRYLRVGDNRLTELPLLPNTLIYLIVNKQSANAPNATAQLPESSKRLATLPALPNGLKVLDINDNKLTSLPVLPDSLVWMNLRFNQNLSCLPTLPNKLFSSPINTGPLSRTSLQGLSSPAEPRLNVSATAISCMPNLPPGINTTKVYYCGGCGVNMASPGALCSQAPTVQSAVGACSLPGLSTGTVKVNATIPAGALTLEYSKDGGATYQTENLFAGLTPGAYTVLTRRKSGAGCPTPSVSSTAVVTACEPRQYYANAESGEDAPDRGTADRPWKSISFALKQIAPDQGHTLNLSAHLFEESDILTVPSGINIVGKGWDQTTIKINSYYRMLDYPLANKCFGNQPGYENYNPSVNRFVIQMNGNNQRLANFFLDGQDKKCHGGILLKDGSNVVFDSLKVTKFFYAGIWLGKGQNLEVKRCFMQDNAWGNNIGANAGLMFWAVQNVLIHDNRIEELTPIKYSTNGTPLGGYTIKTSNPTRTDLCRDVNVFRNVMSGVKIYNNTLKVLPYGIWLNGTAPSITIEFYGTSYKNCEIYGNYINNHISMVGGSREAVPGYDLNDKTVRVHHNFFDLGDAYSYAVEFNAPMAEMDSNFVYGGYYPVSMFDDRTQNWHDQYIHHNVFYGTRENYFPFNYNRYPRNFRFINNTVISAKRLNTLFNVKGSGGANSVITPAAGAEIKNNIFISLAGPQGDKFDERAFTDPVVSNNLFYNINSFGQKRIVVDSTKAPGTILKFVGEMIKNKSLYGDHPQPFFELAEGSPAANAGVVVAGTTDGYQASAPDLGAYESNLTTVTPTVLLTVAHQDGDGGQTTNNHIKPNLQLRNEGQAAVPYGELTARYWFTTENFASINTWVDYAQVGNSNVKLKYVRLSQPREGADGYVEYAFNPSAGTLSVGGSSGPIQSRFAKQNWTDFNEADDYSFTANPSYTPSDKITLYRNGALLWGDEPAAAKSTQQLTVQSENKNFDPATNTISTYVAIRNNGNTPVSYKDLSIRYWFTAEGTQNLNYWVDYAQLGSNRVSGKFVKPTDPLNGADTYFEITIDSTLGSLQPLSTTGNIQYRLAKTDWSAFDETNDHSYKPAAPIADNDRITIYYRGKLVYGVEPEVGASASGRRAAAAETVGLVLYPNPTSEQVIIRLGSSTEPIDVTVTGLNGQVLRQEKTRFNTPIAVDQLTPGFYVLKVQTATQVQYLKLLKQ